MLFITAGMGGGTGTGAAPVIAQIAKELDILTVGIVTLPFDFEGKSKMDKALIGVEELKKGCDSVITILNQRLIEIYGDLSQSMAFEKADDIIATSAKCIAEIVTIPGQINVDFEDVNTVMRNAGTSVLGSAESSGDNRAQEAVENAINSPLLNDRNIDGAKKILLNIAMRAIKTNSIAPTFTAIFIPSPVPIDIAESRLDPNFSLEIFTSFSTISV